LLLEKIKSTYLPFVFVFRDSSVLGAPELFSAHVLMRSLRLRFNDRLRHILLAVGGLEQLDLHLSELVETLVLSDLVSQPDLHRCVVIQIVRIIDLCSNDGV